jgi:signal transduction histidine kinase/DNA-binding response OmpR family regulator
VKWRDLSIVRKLGLLLAFNTLLAVLATALVFSIGSAFSRYHDTQAQLLALAAVVGENSRAALAFDDSESARETLSALAAKEEIDTVRLLDAQGGLFAQVQFPRKDHEGGLLEHLVLTVLPTTLEVNHEMTDGGQSAGRIELSAHLLHIWLDILAGQVAMVLLGALLAALAVYFGMRLRRIVTDPILALAQVTHRVSREQDYSIRATKAHNDEIGTLVDHFNHMLAEIQARDNALRRERLFLEQRTMDMQLARDEAERASRVKSEFISTVSHELRTPLTAISGALGLIAGGAVGPLPPHAQEMVGIAKKNSQRLSYLINDLLDMEGLMAGKLHFDMRALELMPLLEQSLAENLAYGEQYKVRYALSQRADGLRVWADAQRLQQVLANLLSNAAKFSPEGSPVEVAVRRRGEVVRVEVRDHGPGIPASFQGRIFQKFSQADASDTRKKGGTGLGLAISRELIERMGGSIGFESQEGQGACFFFELPVWRAQPPEAEPGAPTAARPGAPRILVVEDDPDVGRLLSQMLRRAGYAVDSAASGAQAMGLALQNRYVAVTLDLLLPDTDGQQIIRELRARPATARLPIIVISARMQEGQQAIGAEFLEVEWLAKPLDQSRLLGLLEQRVSVARPSTPRVLHVEDDADTHQMVRAMAGDRFDLEHATNLREARARVALERFDAVILDLTLPNESGWSLLPAIHEQQPGARVVVLTGGDEVPGDGQWVDAVLRKSSVSPRQLLDAITPPDTRGAREGHTP